MGNERKPTRIYDDVASTSSTNARMNEGSRKRKAPSSPIPDDYAHSPLVEAKDEDDEGREDEEEEKEDSDDEIDDEVEGNDEEENEEENGIASAWPKSDDCELFKRIRKACPKDDAMKYESRVNHLNWESIKFQDYSAEECKNRWLHVQTHLRNYRILAEVLEDAESWVDGPCYNNLNKRRMNTQKHPDVQPKKPRTSYMLPSMEQNDAVLEKQSGLEVKNELASTTEKSPALAASNQMLFKAEKMTEPLKPPASAAAYYVMTHHFKLENLTPAEIGALWGVVPEKEKKKCIEEHKKRHKDYVREFEKFIRALNEAELKSYRIVMKNRARDQEDGDKENKSTSASLKSPEGSSDSPSKESVASADSKSVKSSSNVNVKSSTEKMDSETLTSRPLAPSHQSLFVADKMVEPTKPPASAAAYYVMTHQSKLGELSPAEIDVVWIKLSGEQRKKCIEEHSNKYEDYVLDLDKFAKSLNPAELRSHRTVMENRDQEDGDKESKSISASSKSPEGSTGSPSKKSAASADSKSDKPPSQINSNMKSSTEKMASTTLKSSSLAASHQSLFKAEKMTEPLKPPASAAAYYAMTHHSKLGQLTHAEIEVLWGRVSEKEKKKFIEELKKVHKDYLREFEKFIRTLNPAELRSYRTIMRNRARDQEEEVKESSDEESSDEERNDEERML
ncbi:nucleolar transcription factor 1-like isoform X2 [Daphnia pulicaria]|uniref:nucleolar transcription factor 1-like isoform X2 n=1 Tax=Daphnia pulicaria TaxID=35523 RepID=UPI001EEC1415|nr:nucleolar transcription factor 1-like isoform X2 [Daphnia pulicaria]